MLAVSTEALYPTNTKLSSPYSVHQCLELLLYQPLQIRLYLIASFIDYSLFIGNTSLENKRTGVLSPTRIGFSNQSLCEYHLNNYSRCFDINLLCSIAFKLNINILLKAITFISACFPAVPGLPCLEIEKKTTTAQTPTMFPGSVSASRGTSFEHWSSIM